MVTLFLYVVSLVFEVVKDTIIHRVSVIVEDMVTPIVFRRSSGSCTVIVFYYFVIFLQPVDERFIVLGVVVFVEYDVG